MSWRIRTAVVATVTALSLLPGGAASADAVRDAQWHLSYLKVSEAHRYSQGEGIVVGVVDTGVDGSHPDLAGNVLPGGDFVPNGGDGRTDLDGHGTVMAGLIAAHGQGQFGALGIAPKAQILPVRISVDNGSPQVGNGIAWASEHGARVICAAFGGPDSPALQYEIRQAQAADVVVVAAVGNRPQSVEIGFPAAYEGVVAAAGVDKAGGHADVSVIGDRVVLSAPAVDIISTELYRRYSTGTGTSNATAIIAGAAALVRAKYPQLSAREVVHRLTATADDKGPPGRDPEYGYGVVNLVAALTAEVPPLPVSPQPSTSATKPSAHASSTQGAPPQPSNRIPLIAIGLGLLLAAAAGASAIIWTLNRRSG
jgi:type VII secretion-associated serine protease mycosin